MGGFEALAATVFNICDRAPYRIGADCSQKPGFLKNPGF